MNCIAANEGANLAVREHQNADRGANSRVRRVYEPGFGRSGGGATTFNDHIMGSTYSRIDHALGSATLIRGTSLSNGESQDCRDGSRHKRGIESTHTVKNEIHPDHALMHALTYALIWALFNESSTVK